jgi:hypothetical protein
MRPHRRDAIAVVCCDMDGTTNLLLDALPAAAGCSVAACMSSSRSDRCSANPARRSGLTSWSLTNALTAQHLGGSDTPALIILSAGGFGTSAQALQALGSLQGSSPRLG